MRFKGIVVHDINYLPLKYLLEYDYQITCKLSNLLQRFHDEKNLIKIILYLEMKNEIN